MKKLAICGILSLFIGGVASVYVSDFKSVTLQTTTLKAEIIILDEGVDQGGHYYIIDNGRECKKVYPRVNHDIPGMVD